MRKYNTEALQWYCNALNKAVERQILDDAYLYAELALLMRGLCFRRIISTFAKK